jgi:hypothetical protein
MAVVMMATAGVALAAPGAPTVVRTVAAVFVARYWGDTYVLVGKLGPEPCSPWLQGLLGG